MYTLLKGGTKMLIFFFRFWELEIDEGMETEAEKEVIVAVLKK